MTDTAAPAAGPGASVSRAPDGAQPPSGGSRPGASRRREVSHTTARSLLMTLLGEYVLPRGEPVWTSVLVEALSAFGVEEKSARQALARTAAEGWLESGRSGRRARWALTEQGHRLLTEGARRIYEFGSGADGWDGTWLLILVSVPEVRRDLRHRVRARLSWAGFGSPEAGVWICPHTGREAEALSVLEELGLAGGAMSFTASYGAVGVQEKMVARAWDLTALRWRYERFTEEFAGLDPAPGNPVLAAQTRLVHEWRRFPFLDPQLPAELLPRDWSGSRAARLFHRCHAQWRPGAQRRWDELITTHGG